MVTVPIYSIYSHLFADDRGHELVRFVENGNLILMGRGADVYPQRPDLELIASDTARFILKDPAGNYIAVIPCGGGLFLKGSCEENEAQLTAPSDETSALIVKASDGNVASYIDKNGNLRTRGYILVDGIPRSLKMYESTDRYFDW